MAAQNQHYVPKFILRHFLSDEENERVTVYDKHEDKVFTTAIKNVMAERRFHDFAFNDNWIASFEPIACGAEDQVLPAYREVVEQRRLSDNPEQKAALAVLMAFQFLRTKANRDIWQGMEEEIVAMVEGQGGRMQDVQGWENWQPRTEDDLKREHLQHIRESLGDYAKIIAEKDFVLAKPLAGRSFYLGDHPVCMANARNLGPMGNLGLAVPGIEIYMPLTADLMLGAWCPSILSEQRQLHESGKLERRVEALARVQAGTLRPDEMRRILAESSFQERSYEELFEAVDSGRPLSSDVNNMDYYNSLQTSWAYRYVICQQGEFEMARQCNRENPSLRRGRRFKVQ